MVFFTSILIVVILYYLQADGLVYVTIIALIAELINIFLTHTATKSVEKRIKSQHKQIMAGYKNRLKANKNTIKQFEKAQEESVTKLYNANIKIKKYEEMIAGHETAPEKSQPPPLKETPPAISPVSKNENDPARGAYDDLPDGSNRSR